MQQLRKRHRREADGAAGSTGAMSFVSTNRRELGHIQPWLSVAWQRGHLATSSVRCSPRYCVGRPPSDAKRGAISRRQVCTQRMRPNHPLSLLPLGSRLAGLAVVRPRQVLAQGGMPSLMSDASSHSNVEWAPLPAADAEVSSGCAGTATGCWASSSSASRRPSSSISSSRATPSPASTSFLFCSLLSHSASGSSSPSSRSSAWA